MTEANAPNYGVDAAHANLLSSVAPGLGAMDLGAMGFAGFLFSRLRTTLARKTVMSKTDPSARLHLLTVVAATFVNREFEDGAMVEFGPEILGRAMKSAEQVLKAAEEAAARIEREKNEARHWTSMKRVGLGVQELVASHPGGESYYVRVRDQTAEADHSVMVTTSATEEEIRLAFEKHAFFVKDVEWVLRPRCLSHVLLSDLGEAVVDLGDCWADAAGGTEFLALLQRIATEARS